MNPEIKIKFEKWTITRTDLALCEKETNAIFKGFPGFGFVSLISLFEGTVFSSVATESYPSHAMLRRMPTRIEHKLEDITAEYTVLRQSSSETDKDRSSPQQTQSGVPPWSYKLMYNNPMVHERIGYLPQPRNPT